MNIKTRNQCTVCHSIDGVKKFIFNFLKEIIEGKISSAGDPHWLDFGLQKQTLCVNWRESLLSIFYTPFSNIFCIYFFFNFPACLVFLLLFKAFFLPRRRKPECEPASEHTVWTYLATGIHIFLNIEYPSASDSILSLSLIIQFFLLYRGATSSSSIIPNLPTRLLPHSCDCRCSPQSTLQTLQTIFVQLVFFYTISFLCNVNNECSA